MSSPTQLYFDNGNSQSADMGYSMKKYTDWLDYSYDNSKSYVVSFALSSTEREGQIRRWDNQSGWNTYYKVGAASAVSTETVSGYTVLDSNIATILDIEVEVNLNNIYIEKGIGTKPDNLIFNGIEGVETSSLSSVSSLKEWFWSNNDLFYYSNSSPATVYEEVLARIEKDSRPVINGCDLIVDAWTGFTETKLSTYTTTAGGTNYWPDTDANFRQASLSWGTPGAKFFQHDATRLRCKFYASSRGALYINGAYFGLQKGSLEYYHFAGTPTQMLFGSSETVSIPTNTSVWTDWFDYNIEKNNIYVVSIGFPSTSAIKVFNDQYYSYAKWESDADDEAGDISPEDLEGENSCVYSIEYELVPSNIWYVAFTQEATYGELEIVVFNDNIIGSRKVSAYDLKNDYDWFYDSVNLYVYAETDPSTYYNNVQVQSRHNAISTHYNETHTIDTSRMLIENFVACYARSCFGVYNCQHIDIDNCEVIGASTGFVLIDASNVTVSNCKSHDHYDEHGIYLAGWCDDIIIEHSEFYNCKVNGIQLNLNEGPAFLRPIIRYCYIHNNAGGILDQGSEDAQYYYNLLIDNSRQITLQYNDYYHADDGVVIEDAEIYNNTIYHIYMIYNISYCSEF